MFILTIRSDKPEAELGLFKDRQEIDKLIWLANRELSKTIHTKIKELLDKNNLKLKGINGIVVFKGPGSFTGLRIGMSVANALSFALNIPIVSANGEDWTNQGLSRLMNNDNEKIALPYYGAEPHITKQRH